MDISLWNFLRVENLVPGDNSETEISSVNSDTFANDQITERQMMNEIITSEAYGTIKLRLSELNPPINLSMVNNKIIMEADAEDAIRYELSIEDIETNNIVDFTLLLFKHLENIYHSRMNKK